MENQYLALDQLEIGKSYWVVNGCWEFKVTSITNISIGIYISEIDQDGDLVKIHPCTLQIIEKK